MGAQKKGMKGVLVARTRVSMEDTAVLGSFLLQDPSQPEVSPRRSVILSCKRTKHHIT